ncbi:MAG: PorT family protein, partial [Flavobacteriales bacterium]
MKSLFSILALVVSYGCFSQGIRDSTQVDDRYLEDQFYMGITYNFLLQLPNDVT